MTAGNDPAPAGCSAVLRAADIPMVSEEPDFILDLRSLRIGASGEPEDAAPRAAAADPPRSPVAQPSSSSDAANAVSRPWIGIHFECCGIYTRIYRSPDARAYRGRCPRCGNEVTLRVGPDGTASRFFSAR